MLGNNGLVFLHSSRESAHPITFITKENTISLHGKSIREQTSLYCALQSLFLERVELMLSVLIIKKIKRVSGNFGVCSTCQRDYDDGIMSVCACPDSPNCTY